jgi:hypothetical protein
MEFIGLLCFVIQQRFFMLEFFRGQTLQSVGLKSTQAIRKIHEIVMCL